MSICSKFTGAEHEVLGSDLVAEGLPPPGRCRTGASSRGLEHVEEVDEHALGGLGSEVGDGALVLERAGVGLEHEVEGPGLGELRRPAGGADGARSCPPATADGSSMQSTSGSVKVARWPEAAHTAGGLRMAASRPTTSSRRCTIDSHHRFLTLRAVDAERAVVVRGAEAPVDLRRLEDKAPALAQTHHLLHEVGPLGHCVVWCFRLRHRGESYRLTRRPRPVHGGEHGWPMADRPGPGPAGPVGGGSAAGRRRGAGRCDSRPGPTGAPSPDRHHEVQTGTTRFRPAPRGAGSRRWPAVVPGRSVPARPVDRSTSPSRSASSGSASSGTPAGSAQRQGQRLEGPGWGRRGPRRPASADRSASTERDIAVGGPARSTSDDRPDGSVPPTRCRGSGPTPSRGGCGGTRGPGGPSRRYPPTGSRRRSSTRSAVS